MSVLHDTPHQFVPATSTGQPTILLLHGTGGSEHDLLPLGRAIAPGAALLSPRGRVVEHGMPRFFRRFAEGVFDLDDVRQRAGELAAFVAEAVAAYGIDARSVVAAGYSNGANIAHATLLLHPGVFAATVLFHPQLVLTPDPLPDLHGTPVFISAGERDPIVSRNDVEALVDVLTRSGARVTTHWLSGGHSLSRDETDLARIWIGEQAGPADTTP
jgi:phospholipase/carboxylesterase